MMNKRYYGVKNDSARPTSGYTSRPMNNRTRSPIIYQQTIPIKRNVPPQQLHEYIPQKSLKQLNRKTTPNTYDGYQRNISQHSSFKSKNPVLQENNSYSRANFGSPDQYDNTLSGKQVSQMSLDEILQASAERRRRQYNGTPEYFYELR